MKRDIELELARAISEGKKREKGLEDRKIRAHVFDKSTLLAIRKLQDRGDIGEIGRVIATGKEANVYYATTPLGSPIAVKIYKLETSSFHSMKKYILGDQRFEKIKPTRRNIVYTWCQKEYRNLQRAEDANVRVPTPIAARKNVLVMELIGSINNAAPPLVNIGTDNVKKLYKTLIEYVARLLYIAELVHGDLSEYNILMDNDTPVLIDMGQSVTRNSLLAQELLDRDLGNIQRFINKMGLNIDIEDVKRDIRAYEGKL